MRFQQSIYNKTKYLCEKEVLLFNQSWIVRLGVINLTQMPNEIIYLKLSKIPSFGYKILLKPYNKKFCVDNLEDIKEFLNNFLFGT